jgi:hypothetical protein
MYNQLFSIPTWSRIHNPYHYRDRSSKDLIITVGDSWTYGDSLGKTRVRDGVDDTDYRLEHIYGNLLTEQLNTDWMNIALPGGSNYCVLNWLGQLLNRKFNYASIVCIITLSESGRHEEIAWANGKLLQTSLNNIVIKTYSMVQELRLRFPKVQFKVAHSFTDSVPGHNVLEKTWLEILTGRQLQDNTFIVMSDHIKQLNYDRVFVDTPEVIDQALKRINILDSCDYCSKQDSRHPIEQGHQAWANYLVTQL